MYGLAHRRCASEGEYRAALVKQDGLGKLRVINEIVLRQDLALHVRMQSWKQQRALHSVIGTQAVLNTMRS